MDVKISFLKKIHQYYPIGMPELEDKYPGILEIRNLVNQKILELEQENSVWNILVAELKASLVNYRVINYVHFFPSYCILIEIEPYCYDKETSSEICVIVSLLTKHYTIFKQDIHVDGHVKTVVSFESIKYDHSEILKSVESGIKSHYFDYEFVSHALLFNTKVYGGYPYHGNDCKTIDKPSSVFDYLFSYHLCNYEIVSVEK